MKPESQDHHGVERPVCLPVRATVEPVSDLLARGHRPVPRRQSLAKARSVPMRSGLSPKVTGFASAI